MQSDSGTLDRQAGSPSRGGFLALDAFIRTNRRAIAMMFVRLSRLPSGMGVHCDHMTQVRANLSL